MLCFVHQLGNNFVCRLFGGEVVRGRFIWGFFAENAALPRLGMTLMRAVRENATLWVRTDGPPKQSTCWRGWSQAKISCNVCTEYSLFQNLILHMPNFHVHTISSLSCSLLHSPSSLPTATDYLSSRSLHSFHFICVCVFVFVAVTFRH